MHEILIPLQEYVKNSKHPFLPLTRVAQGQHFELFEAAFDDRAVVSASHVSELVMLASYGYLI